MAHRIEVDLLEIELQTELDLLRNDNTIQAIDDIGIDDIFSSSEGDYKLFELNTNDSINDDHTENENIWESYFDKINIEQQKYLNQSQNILSEMMESCYDTVKLCTESDHKQTELNKDATITTNPCVPSHVIPTPPLTPYKTEEKDENISQNTMNSDDYKIELEKLEEEMKEVTQTHHQELQINSTIKWSTLLHESKELYDEYMETTEKVKRGEQRLIMIQYYSNWKIIWQRNKTKKLQAIKVKQDMQHILIKLINKTVIKYQNKDHRVNLWSNLIFKYRHKVNMNRIQSSALWKSSVVDYIMFHFQQTYQIMMNHRNYFKSKCLPLISGVAQLYKQRKSFAMKIFIWYKHQRNKRNLVRIVRGIHQLCTFRKNKIENPLKKDILMTWINYIKCRKCVIQCFSKKVKRDRMYQTILYLRHKTRYKISKKKIICFRNTRKSRIKYLISLQNRKNCASLSIQSYFRMFYVRSIMNDVKSKLSSINDVFSIHNMSIENNNNQYSLEEFKTLDENEYIFDQSIIDFDLKPLSNPPSPKVQQNINHISVKSDNKEISEYIGSSSDESESDIESVSDTTECDAAEDESKDMSEIRDNKEQNEWQFQNDDVAKSWLKRKKKFKPKKKVKSVQSRLNRFNQMKQKTFGSSNRFNINTKKKSNKKTKPKFVKFGCPQN